MNITQLKENFPTYAKDIKLNLSSVLTMEDNAGLNEQQIMGIALASAYTTKQASLITVILTEAQNILDNEMINAVKAATSIMAMNNIYYRFTHLVNDAALQQLPARLRMNVMANPGIDKISFELFSLAVSAINGCGKCLEAHTHTLQKHGVSNEQIQTSIRIAAVINAAAQVIEIEEMEKRVLN